MKNEALSVQGSLQGTYILSTLYNGESKWISGTNAIWAYPKKDVWVIGHISQIGGEIGGIYARKIAGLGPDNKNLTWNYNGWKKDDAKDIEIKCQDASEHISSDGKLQKITKIVLRNY